MQKQHKQWPTLLDDEKKHQVLLFKMNFMIKNEGVKRFPYNGRIFCLSAERNENDDIILSNSLEIPYNRALFFVGFRIRTDTEQE